MSRTVTALRAPSALGSDSEEREDEPGDGAHLRASVDHLHPINVADAGLSCVRGQSGGAKADRCDFGLEPLLPKNFRNGLHERGDADDACLLRVR